MMKKRKFDANLFQSRIITEIVNQNDELDFPNLLYPDTYSKAQPDKSYIPYIFPVVLAFAPSVVLYAFVV